MKEHYTIPSAGLGHIARNRQELTPDGEIWIEDPDDPDQLILQCSYWNGDVWAPCGKVTRPKPKYGIQ